MRLITIFVLSAVLTPLAAAQRQRSAPAHAGFALGRTAHPTGFRRSPYTSLPFPFLGDSLLDDLYSTGYPVASQPPVILLQAASGIPADYSSPREYDREPSPSDQPLMIELQNGRYVRVTTTPANGEALPLAPPPDPQPTKRTSRISNNPVATSHAPTIAASPAHDLPPAILIFRDGHTEEVHDYAIADGTLYARGDFYTDGYWNKKITISTLNVAQTQKANAARNVDFALPKSSNEVITRP